ncbi:hypothetical protein [Prauserella endophytica]|uniref:Uncharacterized protein n=1 Tax=Prauserella endophytica TaxID=1592324 RepID=A0ABY2S0B0_9PSEU|nr:hypothetical protein [Prauserella endophytica]TKG67041.1 hypothetical protein FCN18_24355 [Prauserella endophytica]
MTKQMPIDGTEPLTEVVDGDTYIEVLLRRQAAWLGARSGGAVVPKFPPPLEYFVRAADEPYVRLPEPTPAPKRTPKPRQYRSVESLRAELADIEQRMEMVAGRSDTGDRAAANLSPVARSRTAARAGRRRFAAMDRDLETYARLAHRRDALKGRIARAEAREQKERTTT